MYAFFVLMPLVSGMYSAYIMRGCLVLSKEQKAFRNELELYDLRLKIVRLSVVKLCILNVPEYEFLFRWYLCGEFSLQAASHPLGSTMVGIQVEIGSSLSLG